VTSRIVGRQPNGSCANRRVVESRGRPCSPHRRHRSSPSRTRQANTARSGSREPPGHLQTERIQPGERGQIKGLKGSVSHVEVFREDSVTTSIIGRPRPLSRQRRADPDYTLNCEEPEIRPG